MTIEFENLSPQKIIEKKFNSSFYSTVKSDPSLNKTLTRLYASIYRTGLVKNIGESMGADYEPPFEDRLIHLEKITDKKPVREEFFEGVKQAILETDISGATFPGAKEVFEETIDDDRVGKIIIWTGGDREWQKHKVWRSGLLPAGEAEFPDKVTFIPAGDKTKVKEGEESPFEKMWADQEFDDKQIVYLIEDEPKSIKLAAKANKPNLVIVRVNQGKHADKPVPEGVVNIDGISDLSQYLEDDMERRDLCLGDTGIIYDFDGTICDDKKRWEITANSVHELLEQKDWL